MIFVLAAVLATVRIATPPAPPPALREIRLAVVATGLDQPVGMAVAPGDARRRLFVVEKTGRVRILVGGKVLAAPFLDLSRQVSRGMEQGLLGLAFHPRYASNGRFFVNYTDRAGDTRIVAYRASRDPDRADPASAREVLSLKQPFRNHNGGHLAFGPDGLLYIGTGDGGGSYDPHDNAQNPGSLLGKMLRLDVDADFRPEILMSGLRNPWRYSFDRRTGDLYIADVGQNRLEEINALPGGRFGGLNLGWDDYEGSRCLKAACDAAGMVMPIAEFDHADGSCSITGGHVYRGKALPELDGRYFFSDWCSGILRSLRWSGGAVHEVHDWKRLLDPAGEVDQVTAFGEDADGELHILSQRGRIFKLERAR